MIDLFPVHYVPPGRKIFRPAVVIFQVIGVLPNVIAKNRKQTLGNGIVLIGGADDLQFTARFARKPYPSAAELLGPGVVEFGFEVVEVAEAFLDHIRDCATGLAAAFRLHDLPEHGVIHVTATVISDSSANVVGNRIQISN